MEQIACILVGFVCMGAGCGFERSLLPRMAVTVFHETSSVTRMSFVATFGLFKAVANAIAGPLADRWGRKPLLVAGCLVGLPVMPYVTVAATWNGVTYINAAFGLSQGFLGSSLFFLLIDVMGPTKRGVAVGIGESTIYISMAATNLLAGYLAEEYGFRPVPFYCATFFTVVGLLAAIPLKDTLDQVRMEQHEIVISSGDRKKIRKYARMMSTQPSHMDEESIIARIDDNGETLTLDGSFLPSFASPYQSIRTIPVYESEQNGLINPPNNVYLGESGYASTRTSGYNTPRRGFLSGYQSPADTSPNNAQFAEVKGESTATLTADLLKKRQTISFSPEWEKGHYGYLVDAPTIISVMDALEQPAESSLKTLRKLLFHNSSFATLCLSGMILNFKEGFAWGSFPVFFKRHDLSEENITLLVALYPLAWGLSQ